MKKMLMFVLPVALVGCTLSSDLNLALSNPTIATDTYFMNGAVKTYVACDNDPNGTQVVLGVNATGALKEAVFWISGSDRYSTFTKYTVSNNDPNAKFENNWYRAQFTVTSAGIVRTPFAAMQEKQVWIADPSKAAGNFIGVIEGVSPAGARTSHAKTSQISAYDNCQFTNPNP